MTSVLTSERHWRTPLRIESCPRNHGPLLLGENHLQEEKLRLSWLGDHEPEADWGRSLASRSTLLACADSPLMQASCSGDAVYRGGLTLAP